MAAIESRRTHLHETTRLRRAALEDRVFAGLRKHVAARLTRAGGLELLLDALFQA